MSRSEAFEDVRRRVAGLEGNENHSTAAGFDELLTGILPTLPVRALDEHVRYEPLDCLRRGVFLEDQDRVHEGEARDDLGTLGLRRDRAIGTLPQAPDGRVRVD